MIYINESYSNHINNMINNQMNRIFIGAISRISYFYKFRDITIDPIDDSIINVYIIPNGTLGNADNIDITNIQLILSEKIKSNENSSLMVSYDYSGYDVYNEHYVHDKNININENFKLYVNNVCIHSTQYFQKYLLEFEGTYTLKETTYIDH